MSLKKQIAIALVSNALAEKTLRTGVKVFINTCRPASTEDLCVLVDCLRKGVNCLVDAYKDGRGFWHFVTTV